jgi:hypothetical protein
VLDKELFPNVAAECSGIKPFSEKYAQIKKRSLTSATFTAIATVI